MPHSVLLVSPPSPLPRPKTAAGLKLPGAGSVSLTTVCKLLPSLSLSFPSCTGRIWVVQSSWRATKQHLSGALKSSFPLAL